MFDSPDLSLSLFLSLGENLTVGEEGYPHNDAGMIHTIHAVLYMHGLGDLAAQMQDGEKPYVKEEKNENQSPQGIFCQEQSTRPRSQFISVVASALLKQYKT